MGQALPSTLQISHLKIFLEYHYKYFFHIVLHIISFQTVEIIGNTLLSICSFNRNIRGAPVYHGLCKVVLFSDS